MVLIDQPTSRDDSMFYCFGLFGARTAKVQLSFRHIYSKGKVFRRSKSSLHSESSKVSANAQGPNPYGSFGPNPAVWDLPVLTRSLLSLPCNGSKDLPTLSCDDPRIEVIPPHALINGHTPLAQRPLIFYHNRENSKINVLILRYNGRETLIFR